MLLDSRFNVFALDQDECLSDPCTSQSTCENTIGSYLCTCDHGYTGNGFTSCTGSKIGVCFLIGHQSGNMQTVLIN